MHPAYGGTAYLSVDAFHIENLRVNSNISGEVAAQRVDVQARAAVMDTLMNSLTRLCKHHGISKCAQALKASLPTGGVMDPSIAVATLQQAGMSAAVVERKAAQISEHLWPVVLLRKDYGG